MEIDLGELQEGANEYEWSETPEELHIEDPDLRFAGPIRTRMSIHKLGDSLSASGDTDFRLRLDCARCLEPFDLRLTSQFRFIFQKGRPTSMEGDEDETLIWLDDEKGEIDLGEEVKDYILLEIPINPFCKESCAGLCHSCGENLNIKQCACKTETIDPRWETLRTLKGDI